jgi:hypothetical protein
MRANAREEIGKELKIKRKTWREDSVSPFLYDTKSPDYRDQHMRANAWEEIGKELKIKRKTWREDNVSPLFIWKQVTTL